MSKTGIQTSQGFVPFGGGGGGTESIQVDTMPAASIDKLGKVYQYIGTTTQNYTHGYFYECQETSTDVYGWVNISVNTSADISNKADKVTSATNGNFAGLDSNGNLTDSGKKASDFVTSSQAIPSGGTTGQVLKKASGTDYDVEWGNESGGGNLLDYALEFSSDEAFTLSVGTKGWDGTIEYSTDNGSTWTTWTGSELSGTASQAIYLRGTENTVITGAGDANTYKWTFTGKYITGNIENLLDYRFVRSGQHPVMGSACYAYMFQNCTKLKSSPDLPAINLTFACYRAMFDGCLNLIVPPKLPALKLTENCYNAMFYYCSSLVIPPSLPATELAVDCYASMFRYCSSLIALPTLVAKNLSDACYYYMFNYASNIKLSATQTGIYQYPFRIPIRGTGTNGTNSVSNMFSHTGGTFKGTPTINTTYYTDHPLVGGDEKGVVLPIDPTSAMIADYPAGAMWIETT